MMLPVSQICLGALCMPALKSIWNAFGSPLEAFWKPLGSLLEAFGSPLETFWKPLEACHASKLSLESTFKAKRKQVGRPVLSFLEWSYKPFHAVLEAPGGYWTPSAGVLERLGSWSAALRNVKASWQQFGRVLGGSK